jgi:DNA helicase-2/ATP-dependent DNA helicase PcrA
MQGRSVTQAPYVTPPSKSGGIRAPKERPPLDIEVGDNVQHAKFGEGVVIDINVDETVTVLFRSVGQKRLMLKYAPLKKI